MTDELTTIKVNKSDAAELKQRYPQLKNDAYRVSALLGKLHIVSVDTLPGPDDAEKPLLVTVK